MAAELGDMDTDILTLTRTLAVGNFDWLTTRLVKLTTMAVELRDILTSCAPWRSVVAFRQF